MIGIKLAQLAAKASVLDGGGGLAAKTEAAAAGEKM